MPDQAGIITVIMDFALGLPALGVYLFLFVSALLQQWFPPYPSDTFLVLFGALSAAGAFSPLGVYISYVSGTIISTLVLYELGVRNGDRIFAIPFIKKYLVGDGAQNAIRMIRQYGAFTVMLCKFVPGINTVVLILAGIIRIRREKAYAFMIGAALVHNTLLFFAGRAIGDNIAAIEKFLSRLGAAGLVIGIAAAVIIAVVIMRSRKKKKAARNAAAPADRELSLEDILGEDQD